MTSKLAISNKKIQVHQFHFPRAMINDNFITLIVTRNRTGLSCNHPTNIERQSNLEGKKKKILPKIFVQNRVANKNGHLRF